MLRELGIALLEVEQPTPLVAGRLINIAARYTGEQVRIVTLPTALVVQVGSVAYEVEVSNRSTIQLDLAGRIDLDALAKEALQVAKTAPALRKEPAEISGCK